MADAAVTSLPCGTAATTEDAGAAANTQSTQQTGNDKDDFDTPRFCPSHDRYDDDMENAGSLNLSDRSSKHSDEETGGSDIEDDAFDPVFEEIKKSLSKMDRNGSKGQRSSISSGGSSEGDGSYSRVSDHFTNIPFGIQPRDAYEHGKKDTDIMGVTYNGRMRQFVLLDSKGIVSWKRDAVDNRITRSLSYPKYEYRLITYLVYARKYNCYFALWKDFSLRVLNRDFCETCSVSADLRSVLFMLFNPIRDELITGGVGGIKVYRFHQAASKVITELKPLANYQLTLKYELPNVGGSWVKKVELDYNLEHLYCCSDTDLHVYNLEGKELFKFNRAHTLSITGCRYSIAAKVLVTSSLDTEVKVWSLTGGLVHTFRGHSRAVTNLLVHPHNSTLILTTSLDGSLRMWSLDTMDAIYSVVVSSNGLLWMGLTDDHVLYISTARSLTLWHLNHFLHFWSLTRNQVTRLQLEGCPGKTQRVLAVGEDSSIRLFARSNQKNLSTVLPPPIVSPLQKILGVCYSREFNVIFVLINPTLIWVYTTRTDPACRIAVWEVLQIQAMCPKAADDTAQERTLLLSTKTGPSHRATENGAGNEPPCPCLCLCILKSSAMLWTDEGCCCPVRHSYLLLGMEDGRVLFMDPVVKGQKFMEFKVSKDPVVGLHHDVDHQCLTTLSQTSQLTLVQFWSLPDLELLHEVFCLPDLAAFTRIGYMCVTGHDSGSVLFHTLDMASDPGLYKGRFMPEVEEVVPAHHRPEHNAPVINVDACVPMNIFCSCSKDGVIKVWEEGGALLTEITLDDSLSAACFLNKSADMVVAYQKHIFFISHCKVCPHLKPDEPEDHTFDKESYVYEDPAVVYEGVVADPDPISLENYLVPFEIEFSKDFLEGKLTLEPKREEPEESDEEGRLSLAPTDIYLSPPSTPGSLSRVDLTLRSEVSKYDLLQQMKSTLQMLIEKQKEKQKRRKGVTVAPALRGGRVAGGGEEEEEETPDGGQAAASSMRFQFPRFEGSPGPTPTLTPSSTPEPLSEAELSEEEQSDVEDQVKELLPPKKIPDLELVAVAAEAQAKADKSVGKPVVKDDLPAPKRTRKAISDVEIDAETLMKGARRAPVAVRKEADHSHVGGITGVSSEGGDDKTGHRAPVKKRSVTQRKLPKRGSRSSELPGAKPSGKDETTETDGAEKNRKALGQEKPQPSQPSEPSDGGGGGEKDGGSNNSNERQDTTSMNTAPPGPASPTPEGDDDDDDDVTRAEAPPLPALPDTDARPPSSLSSKSHRSPVQSAGRKRPMQFLRDRPATEVGMSPTAELESVRGGGGETGVDLASEEVLRAGGGGGGGGEGISPKTSTTDSAVYAGRSGSVRSAAGLGEGEGEDGARSKSQMSWFSSKEGDGPHMMVDEDDDDDEPAMGDNVDSSQRPPLPVHRFRKARHPSKGSDSVFEGDDEERGQGQEDTGSDLRGGAGSQPASPGMTSSPRPPFSSAGSGSRHARLPSSSLSFTEAGGRDSVMSGAARPPSMADSLSERMGSPDSAFPDAELASVSLHQGHQGGGDVDEHRAWSRIGLPDPGLDPRPSTTALPARPEQFERLTKRRPFTAAHTSFQTELELMLELPRKADELNTVFEAALHHYRQAHGDPAKGSEKLYVNKGVTFEEKWHERVLERHMLLRMQRVLRAHAAQQRRQMMHQQRVKSAPQHKGHLAGLGTADSPGKLSRPKTANPSFLHAQVPTPAPTPTPSASRPQTAVDKGAGGASWEGGGGGGGGGRAAALQEKLLQRQVQREKEQLGDEQPFRFRLRETSGESSPAAPRQHKVRVDPWLLDPRNPRALRPPSSKSIPSKCSRYVLLSRPRTVSDMPTPTALEEELLAARFPAQSMRLLHSAGAALRPTPPHTSYGISYTPFSLYS
ncbi:uncharacterized protein LOC143284909 isoform X2 [Babylonia areolata]|uniref:uncharacterized protein LOC143284909 isoform X2 n=1 Tax=Babylonia areolata TaxID=304850 RepID=UPI003FD2F41C